MREYLFRGKNKHANEWVEGSLFVPTRGGDVCIMTQDAPFHAVCYDVIPDTVGQFTGLMDKNGERIFEGDVLEGNDFDADDGYGVVEWNDGAFEINNHYVSATFRENYWSTDLEIIGNIHDNPELVERVV